MVTLRAADYNHLSNSIALILERNHVGSEVKWSKTSDGYKKRASIELLKYVIDECRQRKLYIDVLGWDTHDSRHRVRGRDDAANLGRMYFHLFSHVLKRRWSRECNWRLRPDVQCLVDWTKMDMYLREKENVVVRAEGLLADLGEKTTFVNVFSLMDIVECRSHEEPLAQLADILAGLMVWSRSRYNVYLDVKRLMSVQYSMDFDTKSRIRSNSRGDRAKAEILHEFINSCKQYKLGVGLESSHYLITRSCSNPINFWWYEPQQDIDQAPTRMRSIAGRC